MSGLTYRVEEAKIARGFALIFGAGLIALTYFSKSLGGFIAVPIFFAFLLNLEPKKVPFAEEIALVVYFLGIIELLHLKPLAIFLLFPLMFIKVPEALELLISLLLVVFISVHSIISRPFLAPPLLDFRKMIEAFLVSVFAFYSPEPEGSKERTFAYFLALLVFTAYSVSASFPPSGVLLPFSVLLLLYSIASIPKRINYFVLFLLLALALLFSISFIEASILAGAWFLIFELWGWLIEKVKLG